MSGRAVLITGGAKGIGRALVEAFVAEGDRVVAVDLDAAALAELSGVTTVVADISSPEGVAAAIAAAGDRIDVLVNNAAAFDGLAPLDEVSDELWARVLAVNLTGPFLLCRAAVSRMVAQGGGAIVNISSVAGLRGARGGAAYAAAKGGLISLTQHIAGRFAADGIRCNVLCPGAVATTILGSHPMTERARSILGRDRDAPPAATPGEIAAVAVFAASDAASRLNGAIIPVDGGALTF